MSLSIGEFFVSLGIKGSDKTIGAISQTKKGMGELYSTTLETKAAILATVYGLERLMASSAQFGTNMVNASTTLNVTSKELQQYQYAGRQAGATNEEMIGSFQALQGAMAQVQINKGLPEGLKFISQAIGGLDIARIRDLPYMMQQFQKFAQLPVDAGVKAWALGTVGVRGNILAGMERGLFSPEVLAKAPTYGDAQYKQLDKVNIAMSNLSNKIQMSMGAFTAKHGMQLVKDVDAIATAVLKLAEALERVSVQTGAFEKLSHAIEGVANSIQVASEAVALLTGKQLKKGDALYMPPGEELLPGWTGSPAQKFLSGQVKAFDAGVTRMKQDLGGGRPSAPPVVNQNITHVGDAKDTRAVGRIHKEAAEKSQAYRSNSAQTRGN